MGIARELEAMAKRKEPVMRRIFLAGIVCVIDASTFWGFYHSTHMGSEDHAPLSQLLVSQVESSDSLIINKKDLVSEDEFRKISDLVCTLSPNARNLPATRGNIPLSTLLPAVPINLEMPAYVPSLLNRHNVAVRHAEKHSDFHHNSHGHGHSCGHDHARDHEHGEDCVHSKEPGNEAIYGLSSFVYRRQALFNASRLAAAARQLPVTAVELGFHKKVDDAAPSGVLAGVLRSKGFIRVSGNEAPHFWSHAGKRLEVAECSAAPCRGQELVLIGVDMDKVAITALLDNCLEPS